MKDHLHLQFTLFSPLQTGQTPLSIAHRLGYISVVEVLRHVTEVQVPDKAADEKYKVVSPETMQETLMTDSEDEGGEFIQLVNKFDDYCLNTVNGKGVCTSRRATPV